MSNIIEKLTANADDIPLIRIFASIFGLSIIRLFLESYSSADSSGYLFPWNGIYLHIPLFYISIFLSFSILLIVLTKTKMMKVFLFLLWVNIFILIPPIIDLLITNGAGLPIHYTITWPKFFIDNFVKMFGSFAAPGITPGIHIAGSLLVLSIIFYVYTSTKNILRSFLGASICLIIFFLYSILPSLLIINFPSVNAQSANLTYTNQLMESLLFYTQTSLAGLEKIRQISFMQNMFLGQILWILIFIQGIFLFKHSQKNAGEVIKTTVRTERILNYFLIASIGIIISFHISGPFDYGNIANMISVIMFFLLLGSILVWETFVNDREDIAIDQLTNPTRPLARKIISIGKWDDISNIIAILVVAGLLLMNQTAAFFLVLLSISYYLYSAGPLRLKRHFISSSVLIGLATVSTAMAGFFLVSPDQKIQAFPINAIFIIGIVQALLSNLKDIKDYAGDKKEGILTIPVVFGEKKAKIIISMIYAFVFISLPVFLQFKPMIYVGVMASVIVFHFLNRETYKEKYIFMVMFIYMLFLYLSFT